MKTLIQACVELVFAVRSMLWQYAPESIFIMGYILGMITAFVLILFLRINGA